MVPDGLHHWEMECIEGMVRQGRPGKPSLSPSEAGPRGMLRARIEGSHRPCTGRAYALPQQHTRYLSKDRRSHRKSDSEDRQSACPVGAAVKGGTIRKLLLRMLRDGQLQRGVEETNVATDATLGPDHRGELTGRLQCPSDPQCPGQPTG